MPLFRSTFYDNHWNFNNDKFVELLTKARKEQNNLRWKKSKGMKNIEVVNYYDENKMINIALDILKTPSENAQAYFKKYNKLKTAQTKVFEQYEKTTLEIAYLEQVLVNIEQSPDHQNIEDIKEELILSGYVKKKYKKKQML